MLYETIIQEYLTTNWSDLAADLPKRTKEIARMTRSQQADVTYIRQAVLDGEAWHGGMLSNRGTRRPSTPTRGKTALASLGIPAADGLH